MYVTRPLSLYLKDQAALSLPPPEGPNSGFLVISDEEAETRLGVQKDRRIRILPFPQNRYLSISDPDDGNDIMFVPVLNQPLSANRYYLTWTQGRDKGETISNHRVFGSMPLRPLDIYQQFEIIQKSDRGYFEAKSIAADGRTSRFLRKEWKLYYRTPSDSLKEALGLNSSLRAQLPDFKISSSSEYSSQPVVVGKWYCPFMFVKEHGKKVKKTMETLFYEMTLEQRWVRVFSKENGNMGENGVLVQVEVQTEAAKIAGIKDAFWNVKTQDYAFWNDKDDVSSNGVVWFTSYDGDKNKKEKTGLSMAVVERMKWEQGRAGWVGGNQKILRAEEFGGKGVWRNFSCYLLVETSVLKRKDGSLVLTCDYKHVHQLRCKWE